MLINLVKENKVTEARLDTSVRRLLRVKFQLGLFDNPFVDVSNAEKIVGNPEFRAAGELAQRKSIVLLKNDTTEKVAVLPLKEGIKIYLENIDPAKAAKYGTVVEKPEQADFAIIRLKTPSQLLKGSGPMGRLFGSGDLDFKDKEKERIVELLNKIPSIVDIYMDRPAVIPEIAAAC